MPWKNGGGTTHELFREGNGPDGWALRISMAEVTRDGPFSLFPDVHRVILLIQGNGFVLHRPDGLEIPLLHPAIPFSFLGEDPWQCRLVNGPVLDFNVMSLRTHPPLAVHPSGPGLIKGRFFLCLKEGTVGHQPVTALELLELQGVLYSDVPGIEILSAQTFPGQIPPQ